VSLTRRGRSHRRRRESRRPASRPRHVPPRGRLLVPGAWSV